MKWQVVVVAGPQTQVWKVLSRQLEHLEGVEHVLVATTASELASLLSSQHVDLVFISQSLFDESVSLSLPPFVVVEETPNKQQAAIAYRKGAKGCILEDVTENGLRLILRGIEQGEEDTFFLNPRLAYEILQETDALPDVTDISSLTRREQEVLYLLNDGLENKDIAKQLNSDDATVRTHIANIEQKFNVTTRYQILKLRLPKRPTNSPFSYDREKRTK